MKQEWSETGKCLYNFKVQTWMSRKSSAKTEGPLSMALPEPLKTRPSMSSETAIRRISPVNSQVVCLASMPEVPSNTLRSQDVGTSVLPYIAGMTFAGFVYYSNVSSVT